MNPYDPGAARVYAQYSHVQHTREMSLEERLLDNRILFLAGPISERSASIIIMQLLYLQSVQREKDINLYINSAGGLVDQTLAIYDTMQFLVCDVATYCIGQAASGAAIVLAAGTKGKRYMLPNAKIMLHQPYSGITGQAEDIRIQAEEVLRDKRRLIEILSAATGQSAEKLEQETERDRFMSAEEAIEYGIVDEILQQDEKKEKKEKKGK